MCTTLIQTLSAYLIAGRKCEDMGNNFILFSLPSSDVGEWADLTTSVSTHLKGLKSEFTTLRRTEATDLWSRITCLQPFKRLWKLGTACPSLLKQGVNASSIFLKSIGKYLGSEYKIWQYISCHPWKYKFDSSHQKKKKKKGSYAFYPPSFLLSLSSFLFISRVISKHFYIYILKDLYYGQALLEGHQRYFLYICTSVFWQHIA